MEKVLISGGTGLVGKALAKKLHEKGYLVSILSRKINLNNPYKTFIWEVEKNKIDINAIINADYIIHLAGENIGAKRWTNKRLQNILDSRVQSGNLLFETSKLHNPHLKAFISASAVGIYGTSTSTKIFKENDIVSNDILGTICQKWEKTTDLFKNYGIRTVKIRTGIVLNSKGSILDKFIPPIKLGIGAVLGSGKQYLPWIHIDDLCEIYIKAIEDEKMSGVYNAVAPEHITNKEFTKAIAKKFDKKIWLPRIPSIFIKIIFGKMASLILNGSRISSEKLTQSNFKFKYLTIKSALDNLFFSMKND